MRQQRPILIVLGTRPEGIKLLPLYLACKRAGLPVLLCNTGQHEELLAPLFDLFQVVPDVDFSVAKQGQTLSYLTQAILEKCETLFKEIDPSLVVVQGDTTTAFAAALSAFYARIPIAHVEAGLRTNDLSSPFPEEMNRKFIALVAQYHFAPTQAAVANLLLQGAYRNTVFCVGNTVVDALRIIQERIRAGLVLIDQNMKDVVEAAHKKSYKMVLMTMHRRESWDGGIERVLKTIERLLSVYQDLFFIFPCHPNPVIQKVIHASKLSEHERFFTCPAVAYHDLVYLLSMSDFVMTDSGGIQEEAASLGKVTLVLREHTERMESVWAGLSFIVGTDEHKIMHAVACVYARTEIKSNRSLYGDGYACEKIVENVRSMV